jgi:hypothetical protein
MPPFMPFSYDDPRNRSAVIAKLTWTDALQRRRAFWPKGKEPRGLAAGDLFAAIDAAEANEDQ